MQANLIFSQNYLLEGSNEFIDIFLFGDRKIQSAIKTSLKAKLITKKFLFRLYRKLLRSLFLSNIIHSYILVTYLITKELILRVFPTELLGFFSKTGILLFAYQFLLLYRVLFVFKMILEWFPVKNWDRTSPLKRFLRRSTQGWTKPFENYFPSFFAWVIAINLMPIITGFIGTSFILLDFKNFPAGYKFEELVTYIYLYTK